MNSLILALELKTCRSNPTHHYSSEHSVLSFKPVLRIWEDWIAHLYALFLKSKNTFIKKIIFEKKSGTVETVPTEPGAAPLLTDKIYHAVLSLSKYLGKYFFSAYFT